MARNACRMLGAAIVCYLLFPWAGRIGGDMLAFTVSADWSFMTSVHFCTVGRAAALAALLGLRANIVSVSNQVATSANCSLGAERENLFVMEAVRDGTWESGAGEGHKHGAPLVVE